MVWSRRMDQSDNAGFVILKYILTNLSNAGDVVINDSRFGPSNYSLEYRR